MMEKYGLNVPPELQNQTLGKRLHDANVRIGSLEVAVKKSKLLAKELARKDKLVHF